MKNKIINVIFANERLEKDFKELKEEDEIKKGVKKAIKDIQQNPFCGVQIPKRLMPEEYIKRYQIKNLWKYDLPNAWRLMYSVTTPTKIEILSIIIEWFNHKDYERRFRYIFI